MLKVYSENNVKRSDPFCVKSLASLASCVESLCRYITMCWNKFKYVCRVHCFSGILFFVLLNLNPSIEEGCTLFLQTINVYCYHICFIQESGGMGFRYFFLFINLGLIDFEMSTIFWIWKCIKFWYKFPLEPGSKKLLCPRQMHGTPRCTDRMVSQIHGLPRSTQYRLYRHTVVWERTHEKIYLTWRFFVYGIEGFKRFEKKRCMFLKRNLNFYQTTSLKYVFPLHFISTLGLIFFVTSCRIKLFLLFQTFNLLRLAYTPLKLVQ